MMVPIYDGILSTIEKTLQELIEYQSIRKFLWDLVEGKERNMAQLARIGAMVDMRWSLKENLQGSKENKENKKDNSEDDNNNGEDRDEEESEKGFKEIEREMLGGTLLLASYQNFGFV